MSNAVGMRFCPTDKEICNYYLWHKNIGTDTSYVDGIISTVNNIWSLDPWDLPYLSNSMSRSMTELGKSVWYFFGVKETHQTRTTRSGRWKKTGDTKYVGQQSGIPEQITEKRYFGFKNNENEDRDGCKSVWVLHEYSPTFLFPNQMMMIYTICRVEFKGEETEISSYAATQLEHTHYSIPLMGNYGGLTIRSENPSQLIGGHVYEPNEAQLQATLQPVDNITDASWIDGYYNGE